MRTHKRKFKKGLTKRNRKGGFFFSKPTVVSSTECDVNNLSTLTKMPSTEDSNGEIKPYDERMNDLDEMSIRLKNNYDKCCPKGFMGRNNTSPYCNQLNTTFKSIKQHKNDIAGYYGDEKDVGKIKEIMSADMIPLNSPYSAPVKKPWYQFWGGKKTKKCRRKKKRYVRRN